MGNKQGQNKGNNEDKHDNITNQEVIKSDNININIQQIEEEIIEERQIQISFIPELGGGKGWPPDANVVLYHHSTGLIVAGTECGTLYAYGDGFQYMQPAIVQMDITHIISLHEEKILVCFADNSMAVFLLPTLQLAYKLESSWLHPNCGDVTTIHIDESRSKYYAYVGTSEGYVRILHIANEFREVEYCITTVDSGVIGKMAVSDLQLSPKDEKYLIIAYDSIDCTPETGAIVIFDLSKRKSYRTYKTSSGITSLTCNHLGDVLYAGTRQGEVLQLGIDKASMTIVWNSKLELIDSNEDEVISIRKMSWLFPQSPTSDGCLFILLGSFGADTDNLKSVIVALSSTSSGDLKSILTVPPLQNNSEVVGFRIVATWDRGNEQRGATPGLLLLTQSSSEDRDSVRELMVIRCPIGDISNWELEIGMLPEPRPAMEVLPGKSPATVISGCVPGTAIGNFLINNEKNKSSPDLLRLPSGTNTNLQSINENNDLPISPSLTKGKSRRVSARDFFEDVNIALTNFATLESETSTWEMVLASGISGEIEKMDVIFVGHENGCILAWGVTLPLQNTGNHAKSNCWIPLSVLKCDSSEITTIKVNNKYLVVGDDSGNVVVWDCENETNINQLNEKLRINVSQSISSLYIDSTGNILIIGTRNGKLFYISDWNRKEIKSINGIEQLPGLTGTISYTFIGPYWKETEYQQVLYILFSCGYVVIVNFITFEIIAHSGLLKINNQDINDNDSDFNNSILYGFLVNSKYEHVKEITDEMLSNDSMLINQSNNNNNSDNNNNNNNNVPESKSFMKKLKRGSGEVITLPPMIIPSHGPRYLMYVQGKYLIQCDISKFARSLQSNTNSNASSSSPSLLTTNLSSPMNSFVKSTQISSSNIITCELLTYTEDSTRFWSKPIHSLSIIDELSEKYFVTIQSGFVLNRHDCLPNVLAEPYNINCGLILSNGNSYICSNKNIIYSVNPYNPEYLLSDISPSRSDTTSVPPDVSQQLYQKEVVDTTVKKSKRRSSFLTIPTASIDLDKLFLKTYDQRQKDELFRQSINRLSLKEQKEEYTIKSDNVKDTTSSAMKTKAILDETRQNFEERGERINIINKRAEDFNADAAKYQMNTAAHKEKMKLKAQRWGVF